MILFAIAWTRCNVPASAYVVDAAVIGLVPGAAVALASMITLAYGNATWHLGHLKRVFLRGTLIFAAGASFWVADEMGLLPCPSFFGLHALWHLCSAHALMAW